MAPATVVWDVLTCINHAGRKEFTSYLPENTQAVVVQPVGDTALLIAASDTQRGFNKVDQVGKLKHLMILSWTLGSALFPK